MSICGIKSHGYFSEKVVGKVAGFFVGIHMEGPFRGQIKKAQPVSEQQYEVLQEQNRID